MKQVRVPKILVVLWMFVMVSFSFSIVSYSFKHHNPDPFMKVLGLVLIALTIFTTLFVVDCVLSHKD